MDNDRLDLLGQVAVWYYEDNLEQSVIAERIGKSRSMISRMLQEAREQGLVEIRVTYPLKQDVALEAKLCETFQLSGAWVLAEPPTNDRATLLRRLGRLGARCLHEKLRDGIQIGIGWGASLHQLVRSVYKVQLNDARVIQIMGAAGHSDPIIDGSELASWLAQKLGANHRFLPAPLFVETAAVAQSLLNERAIAETLSLARNVDIHLVGIGAIDSRLSGLYRTGYFNEQDMNAHRAAGAVGDLIGRFIGPEGQTLDIDANHCVIGLDLEALRQTSTVIGVAGGDAKAPAILAALKGQYLDVLVTDAITATQVLDLHTDNQNIKYA